MEPAVRRASEPDAARLSGQRSVLGAAAGRFWRRWRHHQCERRTSIRAAKRVARRAGTAGEQLRTIQPGVDFLQRGCASSERGRRDPIARARHRAAVRHSARFCERHVPAWRHRSIQRERGGAGDRGDHDPGPGAVAALQRQSFLRPRPDALHLHREQSDAGRARRRRARHGTGREQLLRFPGRESGSHLRHRHAAQCHIAPQWRRADLRRHGRHALQPRCSRHRFRREYFFYAVQPDSERQRYSRLCQAVSADRLQSRHQHHHQPHHLRAT